MVVASLLAVGWAVPVAADPSPCPTGAEAAADASVRAVFGAGAEVVLREVHCHAAPAVTRADRAVPEPGSRTGGAVRFVLYTGVDGAERRAGRLTAVVDVAAPHVRTTAAHPAHATLEADAVLAEHGSVGRVVFGPLPLHEAVTGRRLRRAVAADTVLTAADLERVALVRSGRDVVTLARIDGLEVRGRAVAVQSGDLGEVVLVVNPDSRKRLRGRVVGPALVEVLHVS
jgi:flagella basal body P-ring formation protein FlgA